MEELNKKINTVLSLLSVEQKKKDILEIENKIENKKIINYLESIGPEEIKYEIVREQTFGKILEVGGKTYLWDKKMDGNWIIKLWQIDRYKNL